MSQEMITLVMDIKFSHERLKEIFEVPETKQLLDRFMLNVEASKELEELTEILKEILKELLKDGHVSEKELPKAEDVLKEKVEIAILAEAIELVVNGKTLNQAIQETLEKQLKQETIIEIVNKSLAKTISDLVMIRWLSIKDSKK